MDEPLGRGHMISERGDAVDTIDEIRKKRLAYFSSQQKSSESTGQNTSDLHSVKNKEDRASCKIVTSIAKRRDQNITVQQTATKKATEIHGAEKLSLETQTSDGKKQKVPMPSTSLNVAHSYAQANSDWKNHVDGLFKGSLSGIDSAVIESCELEGFSVFNSEADFKDLGLSTHRPDSDGEHRDVSLGKDITQEIKQLLGERKYQEFVDKSVKDINELYQHKTTETSPQLIKSLIEETREDHGEADVTRNYQRKKETQPSQDIRKFKTEIPLNNSSAKIRSQRPRLNRPRKEPVHIQNIVTKNIKDLEKEGEASSSVRNYDQVIVPRNVTYSADEIYRQAFAKAHSHIPPPGYHGINAAGMTSSGVPTNQVFQSSVGSAPSGAVQFSYPGQVGSFPNQAPYQNQVTYQSQGQPQMIPVSQALYYSPYQPSDYSQTIVTSNGYNYQVPSYNGNYPGNPPYAGNYPMPLFYPDFTQPPPGWGIFNPAQTDFVPHPPAEKKQEGNKSDKQTWMSQMNDEANNTNNEEHVVQPSQRHVEKIRQHHEQRRQKHEDKIPQGKQKKFASASLDRYFSSLENIHSSVTFDEEQVPDDSVSQADADTCFTSVSAITETSVQAGGLTDRLKNMGIDVKPNIGSETGGDTQDEKPKQKLIKVCPECASWNKSYMSWCADCGEILIGVEVIDAKVKKQKDRELKRQQNREQLAKRNAATTEKKIFKDFNSVDQNSFVLHVDKEEISEDPVTEKNSEVDSNAVRNCEKEEPALNLKQSETQESSFPADTKLKLQPYLRTERDINDICEVITDPTIKGFLKSYFRKKSQAAQEVINAEEKISTEKSPQVSERKNEQNDLAINLNSSEAWGEKEEEKRTYEAEVEIFGREESKNKQVSNSYAQIVPGLDLAGISDEEDGKKKKPFKPLSFSTDSDDWSSVLDQQQNQKIPSQNADLQPQNLTPSGDAPQQPRNSFLSYLLETRDRTGKRIPARPRSADMLDRKRQLTQARLQVSLNYSSDKLRMSQSGVKVAVKRDGLKSSESVDNLHNDASCRKSQPLRKTRPASADIYRRKSQLLSQHIVQPSPLPTERQISVSAGQEAVSPRVPSNVPNMVTHRLPPEEAPPVPPIVLHGPTSSVVAYSKYRELTPRIRDGVASAWLCLPDELWLHIFSFLSHSDLTQCAKVCKLFYRISLDESLWQYITVKKKFNMNDEWLLRIAGRHPVSLALIQCHGENVTAKGLRELFRESANNLKELNFSRCSRGGLTGDSILLHASARCRNLTHVDASWCNVTDNGISAISECAHRLECLCINGCQMLSDEGLETLLKKHGKSLRVLEMFGCFNVTPKGIRSLASYCPNLLTLNLGQCYKLTDSSVIHLSASLGRVENLDLRGCKLIRDDCIRRVVRNCPRLKILVLANCPNISDAAMIEIATYLNDIRSIDVCGCRNVTDQSIKTLTHNCQRLNELDISSTGCTHRSVLLIANYCNRNLETLKLNFLADVTEASLQKLLKHCKKLKVLHLYGCTSVRNTVSLQRLCPFLSMEM